MRNLNIPVIEVERFVQKVQAEATRRRFNASASHLTARSSYPSTPDRRVASPAEEPPIARPQDLPAPTPIKLRLPDLDAIGPQSSFKPALADLRSIKSVLAYQDRDFIHAAYWAVLRRAPDEGGFQTYLQLLRNGTPKSEILGVLRDSPEGRRLAVPLTGLWWAAVLNAARWPIVGSLVRWVTALWNLAGTQRAQHLFVSDVVSQLERVEANTRDVMASINRALRDLETGNRQLIDYGVSKPGKTAHYQLEEAIRGVKSSVGAVLQVVDTKADREDTHLALDDLHGTLRAMRSIAAEAIEVERINAYLNNAISAIRNLELQKADKSSVEAAHREFTRFLAGKADQSKLDAARNLVIRSLEAKAERHEITALTNYFIDLYQDCLTKKDGLSLEQALELVVKRANSDRAAIEAANGELRASIEVLRSDTGTNQERALRDVNRALESLARSKVDQALLENMRTEVKATFEAALNALNHMVTELSQSKVDHTTMEAANSELKLSMEAARSDAKTSQERALRDVNQALESLARSKVDATLLENVRTEVKAGFEAALNALNQTVTELSQGKVDRTKVDAVRGELKIALENVRKQAEDNLRNAIDPINLQTGDFKRNLLDQERRVGLLLREARKRLPKTISSNQIQAMLKEEGHLLDAMYASFEDVFRGARADIKRRQAIYLPYVRDAKAGDLSSPVVDLGCGRGEWLELLRESNLEAEGVDTNRIFIQRCRDLNLKVVENDAVDYLQDLRPKSLGAVTSFHLIEHLPHKTLIALLDATIHALRPGGIAIFETPNPRNVQVGSCNFYMDPTHLHPLPPDLMRYLLEARGFAEVVIKELHPYGPENLIVGGSPIVNDALNRFFFSAQDYAVIGRIP